MDSMSVRQQIKVNEGNIHENKENKDKQYFKDNQKALFKRFFSNLDKIVTLRILQQEKVKLCNITGTTL